MKKILKIIFLLSIVGTTIVPIRAEGETKDYGEQNTSGSLIIDTELNSSVQGRQTTYAEETELYKLFIPSTEIKINNKQQEEVSTYFQEKNILFQKKNILKNSGEEYRSLLFQANQKIKNNEGDMIDLEVKKKPIPWFIIILGGMGLTVMIFSVIFSIRKRRKKYERRQVYKR